MSGEAEGRGQWDAKEIVMDTDYEVVRSDEALLDGGCYTM